MKKRFGYAAAAVLMSLSLAACSNNNQSQDSSANKPSSSKVQKNNSPKKSTPKNNSSSESSKKPSSQAPAQNRMEALTAKLHQALPGMLLPTNDGLGSGSDKLNVRYTQSGNKNVVYYSVGNSAQAFNASTVSAEKPFAVLTETKNASSSDISDIINYMPAQKGLPTKKLDASTTATLEGAAGQKYLQWNNNNYSFVIQASSQLNQDPTNRGKSVLGLSKQYNLPSTSNKGSVHVTVGDSVGSLNTVIAWQNGNNVYQLKAHDTETAFKMLSSLK